MVSSFARGRLFSHQLLVAPALTPQVSPIGYRMLFVSLYTAYSPFSQLKLMLSVALLVLIRITRIYRSCRCSQNYLSTWLRKHLATKYPPIYDSFNPEYHYLLL